MVPCSALPDPAVILRCFILRYLLTPELSLAVQTRAGATTGTMCLNALLSKRVQNGTAFVGRGGADTDEVVAVNSDASLAMVRGAFSLVNPSNARTANADSSDARHGLTSLRTTDGVCHQASKQYTDNRCLLSRSLRDTLRANRLNPEGKAFPHWVWVSGHGGRVQGLFWTRREDKKTPSSLAMTNNAPTTHSRDGKANRAESLHKTPHQATRSRRYT